MNSDKWIKGFGGAWNDLLGNKACPRLDRSTAS